jgi:hypothetical protein
MYGTDFQDGSIFVAHGTWLWLSFHFGISPTMIAFNHAFSL